MTREEKAIIYFKDTRKRLCEDHLNICPKGSTAYKATLAEKDFYDTAIKALEQESSRSERPNKWIPVSERLPDNDCECWVTIGDRMGNIVRSCNYTSDLYDLDEYAFEDRKGESGFYDYDSEYGYYEIYNVIAWMPYFEPKPYKEVSE